MPSPREKHRATTSLARKWQLYTRTLSARPAEGTAENPPHVALSPAAGTSITCATPVSSKATDTVFAALKKTENVSSRAVSSKTQTRGNEQPCLPCSRPASQAG